jgi:hypothetical protein
MRRHPLIESLSRTLAQPMEGRQIHRERHAGHPIVAREDVGNFMLDT